MRFMSSLRKGTVQYLEPCHLSALPDTQLLTACSAVQQSAHMQDALSGWTESNSLMCTCKGAHLASQSAVGGLRHSNQRC